MTESHTQEEFELNHKNQLLNFEKLIIMLKSLNDSDLRPLDNKLVETLETIFGRIPKNGRVQPEDVFRQAMQSLPEVDSQRMIIENLLEAIKRGDKLGETVDRYQSLGLLSEGFGGNKTDETLTGLGERIVKRKGIWNLVGLTLMQLTVNALKTISKFGQIEPIITIAPVPGLSFAIKGKGMSFYDLYTNLTENIILSEK